MQQNIIILSFKGGFVAYCPLKKRGHLRYNNNVQQIGEWSIEQKEIKAELVGKVFSDTYNLDGLFFVQTENFIRKQGSEKIP